MPAPQAPTAKKAGPTPAVDDAARWRESQLASLWAVSAMRV